MSSNDPNDPVAKLQDIKLFLREKYGAPSVQLKILLRPKTSELAKILNGFLNEREMDPEDKLNKTIDALGLVTEIEQLIPGGQQFLTPRMKYAAFGNFLRNTLVSTFSHSNIARNYSSASILSNLLIDQIIHIDELPEFPSYQDPEAFNRQFGPVFNIISSTSGVFTSLITVLPIINKEDIDEWFGHIFKYMDLYRQIFRKFNIAALLSSRKVREPEKMLVNAYNVANTQFTLIENLIQAYQIYQGELPEHLLKYEIVKNNSVDAFIEYLNYIDNAKNTITEDIELSKSNRYISMNVDISDNPAVRQLKTNSRLLESFMLKIKIYDGGIYGQEDKIEEFMERKLGLLERYVQHVGSVEDLVNSALVLNILDEMKDVLPFHALLAMEKGDYSIFAKIMKEWKLLFDEYSYEKANEVTFLRLLSELFAKSKTTNDIDYFELEKEIESNIEHVALQPRLFLALSIIQLIAGLYQGKSIDRNSETIQAMLEIGCPERESWVANDLNQYLDYLEGKTTTHDLDHRKKRIILDPMSWLIPDFSSKPLPDGRRIEYLPFNRKSDSIV